MKFERVGPDSSCDNTRDIESRLQKRFFEMFRADHLPESISRLVPPTGSQ